MLDGSSGITSDEATSALRGKPRFRRAHQSETAVPRLRDGRGRNESPDDQAWNDLPQPQLLWAFGLLILNPPPVSSSLKSITAPRM